MSWLISTNDGCVVVVKVTPRASKSEIAGADADWLRLRLQAPPVDGKANAALIVFFSAALGIPKRAVEILSGSNSRLKRVKLCGISAEAVTSHLFLK